MSTQEAPQQATSGASGTQPAEANTGPQLLWEAAQVRQIISANALTSKHVATLTELLGLTPAEAEALMSGGTALALRPEQYAAVQAALARQYAKAPARDGEQAESDGEGVCGCGGSPTPSRPPTPVVRTPANTSTGTQINELDNGTSHHTGNVSGPNGTGTVTLRSGVESEWPDGTNRKERFAIRYQGTNAQNSRFLQFIWREVIGIHSDASAHPLVESITTTASNSYMLTGGGTATTAGTPGRDNWNTDSASATEPFYEAGFVGNRTSDSTTIYDPPASQIAKVRRAFGAGATRVISRAHFATFLVQNDVVTHKVGIHLTWTFNAETDNPRPTATDGPNGAATGLTPTELRERFHAQYPAYNYIT